MTDIPKKQRRYYVHFYVGINKPYLAKNKSELKKQIQEEGKLGLLLKIHVWVKSKDLRKQLRSVFPKRR